MRSTIEEFLGKHSLFQRLSTADRARLAAMGTLETQPSGSVLFRQTNKNTGMFVIVEGTVRLSRINRTGNAFVLAELHAGDILGDLELLDAGARVVTAETANATTLIFFSAEQFQRLIDARDPVALELVTLVSQHASRRLRELNRAIVDAFNEPATLGGVTISNRPRPDQDFFHGLMAGLFEPVRHG